MQTPRISILLPLEDERDAGVDCARAWVGDRRALGLPVRSLGFPPAGRPPPTMRAVEA